ncbi:hypothetical protein ACWGDT_24105 [Streptomyces avermitilis]
MTTVKGQPALADFARIVGVVLAHHAADDSPTPTDAEVRAGTDAMVRPLIGAPLRSDGKLTIMPLAAEADLRRNKLTHKHIGLKDLFHALVKAHSGRPEPLTDGERARGQKRKRDLARRWRRAFLSRALPKAVMPSEVDAGRVTALLGGAVEGRRFALIAAGVAACTSCLTDG